MPRKKHTTPSNTKYNQMQPNTIKRPHTPPNIIKYNQIQIPSNSMKNILMSPKLTKYEYRLPSIRNTTNAIKYCNAEPHFIDSDQ